MTKNTYLRDSFVNILTSRIINDNFGLGFSSLQAMHVIIHEDNNIFDNFYSTADTTDMQKVDTISREL